PRVEPQPAHLAEQLRERPGCDARADALERLVAPAGRRLADRDLRQRVAGLDAGVRRLVELRVVRRADDLLAGVLRGEEELDVRLVPDRPEPDGPVAGAAVVPRREHLRERG